MEREHNEALEEFLAAFERRVEAAPVVERRGQPERRARFGEKPVDGRRVHGPVADAFAYWNSKSDRTD